MKLLNVLFFLISSCVLVEGVANRIYTNAASKVHFQQCKVLETPAHTITFSKKEVEDLESGCGLQVPPLTWVNAYISEHSYSSLKKLLNLIEAKRSTTVDVKYPSLNSSFYLEISATAESGITKVCIKSEADVLLPQLKNLLISLMARKSSFQKTKKNAFFTAAKIGAGVGVVGVLGAVVVAVNNNTIPAKRGLTKKVVFPIDRRDPKLPSGELTRREKIGPTARRRLMQASSELKARLKEEDARVRSFLVEPLLTGNKFEKAAALVAECDVLSVASHKKFEEKNKWGRDRGSVVFDYESNLTDQLVGKGLIQSEQDILTNIYEASTVVVMCKKLGVVLKFSNPFAYKLPLEGSLRCGHLGNSHSTRRQVRRVLSAQQINEECSAFGVCAPEKYVCLRPGCDKGGLMNDDHCVVVAGMVEASSLCSYFCKSSSTLSVTDDQIDQFLKVISITNSDDLSSSNIMYDEREKKFIIIDTESPYAALSADLTKVCDRLSLVLSNNESAAYRDLKRRIEKRWGIA